MTCTKKYGNGTLTGPSEAAVDNAIAQLNESRRLEAERRLRWGTDNREQMRRLCQTFPGLRGVPGTDPWDPLQLLHWYLETGAPTAGSSCAARFVLQVWDFHQDWSRVARDEGIRHWRALRPFNAVEALSRWDSAHARAFREWVELPFYP